jgi:hypothetical protein
MTGGDEDLRERFAALRREDEALASAFEIRSRARGHSRVKGGLFAAAACLAAAIALVLWLRPVFEPPREVPAEPAVSITQWRVPTEFLLDTPGGELLRSVPAFGVDAGNGNAPEPGQRRRNHAHKVLP